MKIGLFFGTFNPIHIGHLIIANHMVNHTDLEQVWMVVTPQNPFKQNKNLLADYHRLALVNIAVEDHPKLVAKDIEFKLPKPNYTIDTLVYLKEKYPNHTFSLIMGEDNLLTLDKWKNYEQILKSHLIYVYPRPNCSTGHFIENKNIIMTDAPLMDISSTMIRQAIKSGLNVSYFIPHAAWQYLDEMSFYKK